MANYNNLANAIREVIKANGNNEITGDILQQILLSVVTNLGAQYQFGGIATASTNPGTPDYNVAYLVAAGTYPNLGGLVIPSGYIGVLKYNGQWIAETIAAGGGSGSTTLGGLSDVDLTTPPTNGQTLVYDAATGTWKAGTISGSGSEFFGLCNTPDSTALKEVTVSGFTDANLVEGTVLYVRFSNTNTNSAPAISVNGGTAKNITHPQSVQWMWGTGGLAVFVFSSNAWQLYGNLAYTNRYGSVMLVNIFESLIRFKTAQNRYSITPKLAYALYVKTLVAPKIRILRGYDSRERKNEYIAAYHPMQDYETELTGHFVLMMYAKRRRKRVTAKGTTPLKAKIKEGWGEARGALATNAPVTWGGEYSNMMPLDTLRLEIIQRYVKTKYGASISSYAAFKRADTPIFGQKLSATVTRKRSKNNRLFGVAWRINNPEYVPGQGETETTRVDSNGNPRYIYSDVAPLRVWISQWSFGESGMGDNVMGFQVAPFKDGKE